MNTETMMTHAAKMLSKRGNAAKKARAAERRAKVIALKNDNPKLTALQIAKQLKLKTRDGKDNARIVYHDIAMSKKVPNNN